MNTRYICITTKNNIANDVLSQCFRFVWEKKSHRISQYFNDKETVKWCLFTVCRRPVSGSCPAILRSRVSPQTDGRDECENHDGRPGHNIVKHQTSSSMEDYKRQPDRCGNSGDNESVVVPSSCRVVSNVNRPRADWFARRKKIENEY